MSSPPSSVAVNFIEALKVHIKILNPSPAMGLLKVNPEGNTVDDIFGLAQSFPDIKSFLSGKDKTYLNTIRENITDSLKIIQNKSLIIESEFNQLASNASKTKSEIIAAQEAYVFNYGALVYMTKILTNLMNVVKFVEVTKAAPSVNASSQTSATRTTNTGTNTAQPLTQTNTGKAELTAKVMILRLQKDKLLAELKAKNEALEALQKQTSDASLTSHIENIKKHASRIISNLNDHIGHQQDEIRNAKANANAANQAVAMIKKELIVLDNEYAGFRVKVQEQLDKDLAAMQGVVDQYSKPKSASVTQPPRSKGVLLQEINGILAFLQQENNLLNKKIVSADEQAAAAEKFAEQQYKNLDQEMKFKDAYYAMRDIAASSLEFNFE